MRLIAALEAGREDFIDAAQAISPETAGTKPDPNAWSVLECIEHVITVEDRYLRWITHAAETARCADPDKELRLFTTVRNRLTKVESPDSVRPRGRFRTLSAALAAFGAVRDRSVQLVEERGETLYSVSAKHPFFGTVNGAELIQLIDAHARRHADQIRETCEALSSRTGDRMKPARTGKTAIFKRDQPDFPSQFEVAADPGAVFAESDSVTLQDARIHDFERSGVRLNTFQVEGSLMERVQLTGAEFGSAVWKDVRFVACDLANVRAHRISLVRVEFIDCRLTGFSASALEWRDVLIHNSDLSYANLHGGTFRNCEFNECNCGEADLQSTELSGALFRSCNLALTDLRGAKLHDTDFRTSEIEGMVVGMTDLRGAIVEPGQAMILARVLGLTIK